MQHLAATDANGSVFHFSQAPGEDWQGENISQGTERVAVASSALTNWVADGIQHLAAIGADPEGSILVFWQPVPLGGPRTTSLVGRYRGRRYRRRD